MPGAQGSQAWGYPLRVHLTEAAWRRANWLVGNPGHLPALEITAGGFRARICAPMVVALTGAPCPVMVTRADGAHFTASTEAPLALEAGDQLRLGAPARGVRSYWHAVAAGPLHHNWAVPHATRWHKLARNRYRLGLNCMQAPRRHTVRYSLLSSACLHYRHPARPSRWISSLGHAATGSTTKRWTGSPTSAGKSRHNLTALACGYRASYRLHAVTTANYPVKELALVPSRVPANGQPVLFLADHPLTGGYPVIGAVAHYHLDIAGQLPPNCQIRFRAIHPFTVFEEYK